MSRGLTALIVDDDPEILRVLRDTCRAEGLETFTASDKKGALAWARQLRPDLILLDILLPDGTGTDAARLLREDRMTASIPIVAVSGLPPAQLKARALEAGCDDWLAKPFKPAELRAKLQKWTICRQETRVIRRKA
jgi:DNA-binding response OmpR family regulator